MSKYARQAEHAYLQRRARERAPRLVVADWLTINAHESTLADDTACSCGFINGHAKTCALANPNAVAPSPQPAPDPQPTRFAVGDVVRCIEDYWDPMQFSRGHEYQVKEVVPHGGSCKLCRKSCVRLMVERDNKGSATNGWDGCRFELVRRAGEAPAPAGQLREGWAPEPNSEKYRNSARFGEVGAAWGRVFEYEGVAYAHTSAPAAPVATRYPTLDAAMDAVESAVLASEGWTRDDSQLAAKDRAAGDCIYRHASDACVRLFGADNERQWWCYPKPGRGFKSAVNTLGEAMRLALGQVKA